ncbi:unnamed protein product, partial [Symbiodinium pilosum]
AKKMLQRRSGLSLEEKQCMGRMPLYSEALLLQAQHRRGGKESDTASLAPIAAPPEVDEEPGVALAPSRQEMTRVEPLHDVEQQFAAVIESIFPLPGKPAHNARQVSRRAVKVVSPPATQDFCPGVESEKHRPRQAKLLPLLVRERAWNPKEFPLRKNCVELVKGALATRIERALGGSFIFVNEGAKRRPERVAAKRKGGEGTPIHDFRRKLLQKWPSIQEAFTEIDSYVSKVTRPLNLSEWSAALATLGLATQANARIIYDLLDENKDGTLTLQEFRTGVEAAAPVHCMESLRKRLLCLGFPSMLSALSAMQPHGEDMTMMPLNFQQFSECLSRVWVIQPEEHRAVFDVVRDPCDSSNTATLAELLCGLIAVSPPLLLEELWLLSQRRFGGVEAAVQAVKAHCGAKRDDDEMEEESLTRALQSLFGFSPAETGKLLPLIDVDGVEGVSTAELRSALLLAEPSLTVEGLRKKMQLSYRSIAGALEEVVKQSPDFAVQDSKFQKEELSLLLESIEGVESFEMEAVISFVSRACGQQGITIEGFLKGLRLFAPCSVLEAVRLQLGGREAEAFAKVLDKRQPLSEAEFVAALEKANMRMTTEEVSAVFQLLNVRNANVATLGEFVALLQCSRPRVRACRDPAELRRTAAQRVRKDFAPVRKGLRELKQGIRVAMQDGQEPSFYDPGQPLTASTSLPDLRCTEASFARKTFQRISSTLSRVPDLDERGTKIVEIRDGIGGYFESQKRSLSTHEELLEQPIPSQVSRLRRRAQLPPPHP